jgi:hypothetical protein
MTIRILMARPLPRIHVGIRWQQPLGHTEISMCLQMVFLKDGIVGPQWQADDKQHISLFTPMDAVEFGAEYFRPSLAPRREN